MKKIVLVLDINSRKVCEVDASVLADSTISIVTDLNEISENMLNKDREVIVLEGYSLLPNAINNLKLNAKYGKYKYIFAGTKAFVNSMKMFGEGCVCDTSIISSGFLQSVLFGDNRLASSNSPFPDSTFQELSHSSDPKVLQLWNAYNTIRLQNKDLSEQVVEQRELMENKDRELEVLKNENMRWKNGFKEFATDVREYVRTVEQYEAILQKDVYTKISLREYPKAPKIIYLKAFPGFTGMNTLLQTLFNVYKVQKGKSVKVLRLFDSTGVQKYRLLPEYYAKIRSRYTVSDIVKNDYIAKTGDYVNLVEMLLMNKYALDVLIILDEKDYDDVILKCPHMCLCNTQRDAIIYGCLPSFTILSTPADGWKAWDSDATGLKSTDKFIKFSSQPAVKGIVDYFESTTGRIS